MNEGPHPRWDNADDFYAEDERREHSVETRLEGGWYGEGWGERYELYYLQGTGEVVAIAAPRYQAQPRTFGPADPGGYRPVELICWCESEGIARQTFSNWTAHHGELKSLYWLRKACRANRTLAVPGDQVTSEHRDRAAAASGSLF